MIQQDIGDDNAAIFNAGTITIRGDSVFQDIVSDNFEGAEVRGKFGCQDAQGKYWECSRDLLFLIVYLSC